MKLLLDKIHRILSGQIVWLKPVDLEHDKRVLEFLDSKPKVCRNKNIGCHVRLTHGKTGEVMYIWIANYPYSYGYEEKHSPGMPPKYGSFRHCWWLGLGPTMNNGMPTFRTQKKLKGIVGFVKDNG